MYELSVGGAQESVELGEAITALLIISGCTRQYDMNYWKVQCRATGKVTGISNRNDFEEWRREIMAICDSEGRAGARLVRPNFTLRGTGE